MFLDHRANTLPQFSALRILLLDLRRSMRACICANSAYDILSMVLDLAIFYLYLRNLALRERFLLSVRSERQLMDQMQYNLLFRWFVGLGCGSASKK
jgi:hypothetical protein